MNSVMSPFAERTWNLCLQMHIIRLRCTQESPCYLPGDTAKENRLQSLVFKKKKEKKRASEMRVGWRLTWVFFVSWSDDKQSQRQTGLELAVLSFTVHSFSVHSFSVHPSHSDRPVGLVVKASASRAEGPGFESRLRRDFSG